MTISFSDERQHPDSPPGLGSAELQRIAAATLESAGLAASTEVAIAFVDEAAMAELNESHLAKSGPTDVLSFPLEQLEPGTIPIARADGPPVNLGDVFICPAVVVSNAATAGVPLPDEMALMVVHGLLHLLGYDHVVDTEAEQMEQRERELLAAVGFVRP